MDVKVGGRPESLDQRDCAAVGLVCLETSLPEQVARDHAVHALQHGKWLCCAKWRSAVAWQPLAERESTAASKTGMTRS